MNKQELIDKLKKRLTAPSEIDDTYFNKFYDLAINYAIYFAEQLDEPDKPVVPKFVAEWIEYCKSTKLTFLGAFHPVSEHGIRLADTFTDEVWKGIDWAKRNQETFARAWLDGYEVEKEKLYTVEIAGVNSSKMFKNIRTNKYLFHSGKGLKGYTDRLTKKEIKQADERLWQFAKEVE